MQNKSAICYADSLNRTVNAIPCDSETGLPDPTVAFRTVVQVDPETEGQPDGVAIDKSGNLWVAQYEGSQVGVRECHIEEHNPNEQNFLPSLSLCAVSANCQ